MKRPATPPDRLQFRYESDLVEALRPALSRTLFSPLVRDQIEIFSEIPAVHGIPDLAAIRFDWESVRRRSLLGIQPLTSDTEVRVVLAISNRRLTPAQISDRVGLSEEHLQRSVLPYLTEQGWIRKTSSGRVEKLREARNVGIRIITIEAKLRNWRSALHQARRQRFSADAAYIALESSRTLSIVNDIPFMAAQGIGVLSVNAETNQVSVLARPTNSLPSGSTSIGRMLIAERCLDMWNRGEREGQIYPVFGWSRPHLQT